MGATAIEDKLQDGVPEAIANFAKVPSSPHLQLSTDIEPLFHCFCHSLTLG